MDLNSKEVTKRWQDKWRKEAIFEPSVNTSKKKFFITVPFPYPSGSMHLGHMYTWTRADIYARFMRMQGYNVLFPQAFHFTGGPIMGAAQKVKDGDPKTIEAFRKQGVSEADLKRFAEDPKALAEYFTTSFREDFDNIGMSIDWRRKFITTSLNPYFSRFISWQFNKLRALGLITEGKHPVVWCPKEVTPLGDHDRAEGEGESPQKFTIIKFRHGDFVFPAATLRPETIFGATNLWINPDEEYSAVKVGAERWIISKDAENKLTNQFNAIGKLEPVKIKDFLKKDVINPLTGEKLPIEPAEFVDTKIGTGVVMSVPMHAPLDFYGVNKLIKSGQNIKPKKVIDVQDENAIVEDSIKRFGETLAGLKDATKIVYKKEFNHGVMNSNSGEFAGIAVKEVDGPICTALKERGAYAEIYGLTGRVVCRCGAEGIVKILEKQWFIRYSDKAWKDKTRRLIEKMKVYPEEVRLQLLNTLDWLDDKAAARKGGLGTPLPWDKEWIIEPLSDSTIYMAYYTIAHKIEQVDLNSLMDSAFDYIFLDGKEKPKNEGAALDPLKKEFEYWYPLDMRVSAKELLQNHFIFFLMNHAAIFGENNWPRGIQINGWLTVSGEKLSKSKGATLTIKRGLETYSADQLRMIAAAGNGMDDVEWDPATINAFDQRIGFIYEILQTYKNLKGESKLIDAYLISKINRTIRDATESLENFRYGSALAAMFFGIYNEIKLYFDLGGENRNTIQRFLSTFIKLNHPVFPHITEELNRSFGVENLLEGSAWPIFNPDEIDTLVENEVRVLLNTIDDIKNVIKIIKRQPQKIEIGISNKENFDVYNKVVLQAEKTKNIIEIRKALRINSKLLDKLLKNPNKLPEMQLEEALENNIFSQAREHLKRAFKCEVVIERHAKEEKSLPGKPSINIL